MVNNFRAVREQTRKCKTELQQLEIEVNALYPKKPETKQALFMVLKKIAALQDIEFWVDRAEKHEAQL